MYAKLISLQVHINYKLSSLLAISNTLPPPLILTILSSEITCFIYFSINIQTMLILPVNNSTLIDLQRAIKVSSLNLYN